MTFICEFYWFVFCRLELLMRRSYKYAVVWFVEHGSNNNNYLGLTWGERGNETVVINGANRSIGNWKSKPTINRFDGNNSAFCLLVSKTKFIWIRHSLRHPNRIVNRNLTPPAAIASRSTLQLIIIMNHDDIIVKEFFYSPGDVNCESIVIGTMGTEDWSD